MDRSFEKWSELCFVASGFFFPYIKQFNVERVFYSVDKGTFTTELVHMIFCLKTLKTVFRYTSLQYIVYILLNIYVGIHSKYFKVTSLWRISKCIWTAIKINSFHVYVLLSSQENIMTEVTINRINCTGGGLRWDRIFYKTFLWWKFLKRLDLLNDNVSKVRRY